MSLKSLHRLIPTLTTLIFAGACSSTGGEAPDDPIAKGTVVSPTLSPDQQAEFDALTKQIEASKNLSAADFASKHKVPFASGLSYDPLQAQNLSLIQSSALSLDADELSKLGENGFVISAKKSYPSFGYGYTTIYSQDLPVFISADSILYAVYSSYDGILASLEMASLVPELDALLDSMRERLAKGGAGALGAQAQKDVDLYLAVAKSLLSGKLAPPVAGASALETSEVFINATTAVGMSDIVLFGTKREVDFSQFKPRGHYSGPPELERYFRAMMWLGRIDFRMLEAQPDHSLLFHRRQLEGALALRELMDDAAQNRWNRIDSTISAFVGEADYMVLPELSSLLGDLGVTNVADLAKVSDDKITQAIINGKYGTQRIASHIMINGLGAGTMPLSSSFALFGQRYVVDSQVFSNVVYDRVQGGSVERMMPNPLDVGFAALKNNQAGLLLQSELEQYKYAPDLDAMRILVDAHPQDYWNANLYNLWLSSLQTLSPSAELSDPASAGLPGVATTEAWGRRMLNTQLASWAELRHNAILYAKQSYTGYSGCEFPDAYVEPYPEFFKTIDAMALRGKDLLSTLDFSADPAFAQAISDYFDRLHTATSMLAQMAEHQRTGTPFTAEQMAFVNDAVLVNIVYATGCGPDEYQLEGWYPKLFFVPESVAYFDPTIADVHTDPNGGRVLHVGTGYARAMAITVETCTGPRAYVGLASSYFEEITSGLERLDDATWSARFLQESEPSDVPWMNDLISH